MADVQATSYDEVPYESYAFAQTHPDNLATIATLFGLTTPRVERARVLELGCGTGGNLIPMAFGLPEGRFVGLDLSARQVEMGRELIAGLGLPNIELQARSILELGEDLGPFDYIICHGVFSWVPEAVRDRIFEVFGRHLAPEGIAYLSYNVFPGWHARGMIREMMAYHVRRSREPAEKVAAARRFLETLAESLPERRTPYGQIVESEAVLVRMQADSYILHEHLEEENRPFYFHEVLNRAEARGLDYLGDARYRTMVVAQPAAIRSALEPFSADPIEREQYFDFLRNRRFRHSLFCRAGRSPGREPIAEAVEGLRVMRIGWPPPEPSETAGTATSPAAAAMAELARAWPRSIPFHELGDRLQIRDADARRGLARTLLEGLAAEAVELHVREPEFEAEVGPRPAASPLARLLAADGPRVPNLRHRLVNLSAFDRLVIRRLDGQHDHKAIVAALERDVAEGRYPLHRDGNPIRDPAEARQILGRSLGPCLRRFAGGALLTS